MNTCGKSLIQYFQYSRVYSYLLQPIMLGKIKQSDPFANRQYNSVLSIAEQCLRKHRGILNSPVGTMKIHKQYMLPSYCCVVCLVLYEKDKAIVLTLCQDSNNNLSLYSEEYINRRTRCVFLWLTTLCLCTDLFWSNTIQWHLWE